MADAEKLNIGRIITGQGQQRDAIHIAVVPMKIYDRKGYGFGPGVSVKVMKGTNDTIIRCEDDDGDRIGIVDPFLRADWDTGRPTSGDEVWVFLEPGSITALRHDWSHPKLPHAPPAQFVSNLTQEQTIRWVEKRIDRVLSKPSDEWMREFAHSIDEEVQDVMDAASSYVRHGEYYNKGSKFDSMTMPDEFWDHYWVLTGEQPEESDRHSFFSCAC